MLDHFRIVSLLFLDQPCSYLQRHFLYHYMPFPSYYDVNLDLSFGSFSYRSLYQISSPERQNSQNEFPLNTTCIFFPLALKNHLVIANSKGFILVEATSRATGLDHAGVDTYQEIGHSIALISPS